MDRVCAPPRRQKQDHALDLPPAAEMEDVAELAAAIGARRRLAGGIFAEARDQFGRVGRRRPVGKMDMKMQGSSARLVLAQGLADGRCESAQAHAQRAVNQAIGAGAGPEGVPWERP